MTPARKKRAAGAARGAQGEKAAGYSGTPLPKKLGFKEGTQAAVAGAPGGFKRLLGTLPKGATLAAPASRPSISD